MLSVRTLQSFISDFDPEDDARSAASRARTLELLGQAERALDRRNYSPGHITASGVVLSSDRSHLLLVFHKRLGRWLQPGGHIESDDHDTAASAAREVHEETGVEPRWEVDPALVGIDIHEIPRSDREPAHLHHDVVWRFIAPPGRLAVLDGPGRAVWCRVDNLPRYHADPPLVRAVERSLRAR